MATITSNTLSSKEEQAIQNEQQATQLAKLDGLEGTDMVVIETEPLLALVANQLLEDRPRRRVAVSVNMAKKCFIFYGIPKSEVKGIFDGYDDDGLPKHIPFGEKKEEVSKKKGGNTKE